MTLSGLSLFLIGFGVWLVFAWTRYREEYAQVTEGWHLGGTQMVELTVVKDDVRDLACASDQVIKGLHCGYRSDLSEVGPQPPDDRQVLQPYNTTKSELLLGAGLWSFPELKQRLPADRFTVVCNFHVEGVMKSVLVRFVPSAGFGPVGGTVAVGDLTDCMIPR